MKLKIITIVLLVILSLKAMSQDSTKGLTYVEVYHSLTTTPGTFVDRSNFSVEVGRQFDVFSIGLDLGMTTLSKYKHDADHTSDGTYVEIRPNLNIFQQGRFTNTLTIGAGYIFGASESFLTEFTSGIEYSYSDRLHYNVQFGQFYYSGLNSASSTNFFGMAVSYYFKPYKRKNSIIK
jgi:hypothetical protein